MQKCRELARFLLTIPPFVNWVGIVTLALWLLKAVFLDPVTEHFSVPAALGRVLDGVFAAFIAGYVFYILFVLLPDFQARRVLSHFIFTKIGAIVGDCSATLAEVAKACNRVLPLQTVRLTEIEDAFASTLTSTNPNLLMQVGVQAAPATWPQFFEYRAGRTRESIEDLFKQGRFLDAEVVSLLTSIQTCAFFMLVKQVGGIPIRNENLGFMGSSFATYLELCRRLAVWHDANAPLNKPTFHARVSPPAPTSQ